MNDSTVESNEYFVLVITPGSLPSKVSIANLNRANITIVDDDG